MGHHNVPNNILYSDGCKKDVFPILDMLSINVPLCLCNTCSGECKRGWGL